MRAHGLRFAIILASLSCAYTSVSPSQAKDQHEKANLVGKPCADPELRSHRVAFCNMRTNRNASRIVSSPTTMRHPTRALNQAQNRGPASTLGSRQVPRAEIPGGPNGKEPRLPSPTTAQHRLPRSNLLPEHGPNPLAISGASYANRRNTGEVDGTQVKPKP